MTTRPKLLAAIVAAGVLIVGGLSGHQVAARVAAADATATVTATDTPGTGGTPTASAQATPSATHIAVKPIVHNPTPIVGAHQSITLPKPVEVQVGAKIKATGLSEKQALALANQYVPQLFIVAPTYVPKNYILQTIQVTQAQDQQTPPAATLQYVPKGLKKVGSVYPSFTINKQVGLTPIIYPGVKPQTVTISKGSKGAGVVKGTLIDLKFRNGYEIVHIFWTRVTVSYDVSSTIGISKLSVKDLLAVAATVQ